MSNLPGERLSPSLCCNRRISSTPAKTGELMLKVARIHRMTAGSVRAPGEAVGMPALEAAMDVLAEEVGIDPVELRLRNIPDTDPEEGPAVFLAQARRMPEAGGGGLWLG